MAESLTRPPLRDIVVADFATPRAELAGRVLAELGALVVKIEPPGGAEARRMPPFVDGTAESLYWETVAAGKRSVIANIQDPGDRDKLRGLLARADIVVESDDPGVMAGLGLGYDRISAFNPGVIYVSVTPYGQSGPDALSPATDLTIEAASGLLGLQGDGDRPPVPIGWPQASFHAGVQAAADALIALHARETSGVGQHLDVSMQAAMVWTLMNATGWAGAVGMDPPGTGVARRERREAVPGITMPAIWKCADGYITCVLARGRAGSAPLRTVITAAMTEFSVPEDDAGRDWSTWQAELANGSLTADDVTRALDVAARYFARHTRNELLAFGTRESLLVSPVFDIPALLTDPQLRERGYWKTVAGRTRPGQPVRLSATPMADPVPAPGLGADQALLDSFTRSSRTVRRSPSPPKRPFEGLKVADFAWVGVGPIMAKALADHGATVVHVESPSRPDILRIAPPFKDNVPGIDRAQFFANFNTSKLGLTLNLRTEAGIAVARDLAAWSDVVLESFTAGTMERLGLGYAALAEKRPDLVMVSTCLRGQTGPQRKYGGYGNQGAAMSGIYSITGWPDRPPSGPWGAYTDFVAPRYGVSAIAAALLHRQRTGQGQHIDLAQVEAAIHFIEPLVLDYAVNGRPAGPRGHESWTASPHGVYATVGEERYIAIACETAAQWRSLCEIAPLGAFADRCFDDLQVRQDADSEIDAVLADWCATQDAFELAETLKRSGVPAAAVERPTDLYGNPQLGHRHFFVTLDHPVMGLTHYDGPATLFSRTPPALRAAPALGQHSYEVLHEVLGYSEERVAELARRGALT